MPCLSDWNWMLYPDNTLSHFQVTFWKWLKKMIPHGQLFKGSDDVGLTCYMWWWMKDIFKLFLYLYLNRDNPFPPNRLCSDMILAQRDRPSLHYLIWLNIVWHYSLSGPLYYCTVKARNLLLRKNYPWYCPMTERWHFLFNK